MDFKPFKIGKYLLFDKIATGGMAEVYRAKASGAGGFEKQLAIKRILPHYASNEEFRRMFEYEARLSSLLTHSNIVQVYDFVKSNDTYLLAMEYVDGKNLRQLVNKARKMRLPTPIDFSVYVVIEICKGLDYAHKKKEDLTGRPLNIIHRDMSPQNVMLSYEGSVKIVDFGIAKAKDRVDETRSGVIKGKFGYMSPEQANGDPVTHRTDIFSTGIILYEMLTSTRLFAGENDMATLRRIQECVIPSPSRTNPKINVELERIVLKALTKDTKSRYQDAGTFFRHLQEYMNKYHASYTQKEASEFIQKVFADEINAEKKRYEQLYRQSIPFSQGAQAVENDDLAALGEELGGENTHSEVEVETPVTFVEDEPVEAEPGEAGEEPKDNSTLLATRATPPALPAEQPPSVPTSEATSVQDSFGENSLKSISIKKEENPASKIQATPPALPTQEPVTSEAQTIVGEPIDESLLDNTGKSFKVVQTAEKTGEKELPSIKSIQPGDLTPSTDKVLNKNAIDLESPNVEASDRQRERGYNPLSELNSDPSILPPSESEEISLSKPEPAPEKISRERRPRESRESVYREYSKRITNGLSAAALIAVIVGTGYFYQLYMDGKLPELVSRIVGSHEEPVPTPALPAPPASPRPSTLERRPVGDCSLKIESDPAGAKVFVNERPKGFTPLTIAGPCNQAIDLTLRLDRYETVAENVVLKEQNGRAFRSLKSIPMGTVELTLGQNAQVFVNGVFVVDLKARTPYEFPVRAGRKHSFRFWNEVLKINVIKEFIVEEGAVIRQTLELVEGKTKKR